MQSLIDALAASSAALSPAQSEVLRNTPAGEKEKVSKVIHRVMDHNQLFYCTNNEIVVGDMTKTTMDPVHAEAIAVGLSYFVFDIQHRRKKITRSS